MPLRDLQGQEAGVEQLRRAWQHDRVPHALLFTGPEGVGKRTAALALAQVLNCREPRVDDACGECLSCRKIAAGNHPDVRCLEPDGAHLKIGQIREDLQHDAVLKPLEGRRKVYLLDPAESLTPEAANSLLKILEEPPETVVLILISAQPFALLDTIRSRCQEIRFFPLPALRLAPWLQGKLGISAEDALALARLSGGRPAEALHMSEPEAREFRARVLGWAFAGRERTWSVWAKDLGAEPEEVTEAFGVLLSWYRDLLLLAHRASRELLLNVDHAEKMPPALADETPETLLAKCRALLAARDQLSRNVNTQWVLEVLGLALAPAA
ncbi:MAG: DNA polymerase III subunit delta' [Candidatus Firestonebacteria bacterium]|nr:DNA polymerase III subunit delta' [Candidatus Firestonebacteria bacterium]